MARPTIVVGLGGTGQWVLTWLKRDMLQANQGVMPKNVKLVSIDTSQQLEAGTKRTVGGQEEQATVVGGVTLDPSEYIYLGGDVKQLSEMIQGGTYPQIGKWFQAKKWLSTLPQAAFTIDEGAGRIRQFGRLAVFKDLLNQEAGSKLWNSLQTAFNEIRTMATEEKKLEVILVGSFAGGTGSGLFIDIALLLRHLAHSQVGTNKYVMRGFFALPNVFSVTPDQDMKARAFAAWRELNRFMVVNPYFPMPTLTYVERNDRMRLSPNQRIFDACYLVDGKRNGHHIAAEAKFGAFPVMAEAISAMIDEEAGSVYSRYVTVNLAPEYVAAPQMPMYSAIGAFSIQVPAHYVERRSIHSTARRILLQILQPKEGPDEKNKWVGTGAGRQSLLAASDRNGEDRGSSGRSKCRRLLNESIQLQDGFARPTLFMARIAKVNGDCIDANKRQSTVDQLARAGAADPKGAAALVSWRGIYTNLGDDPAKLATQRSIDEIMNFNIKTSYERRQGEKEADIRPRLQEIPEKIRQRYGGRTNTGEDREEFYGLAGDRLDEVKADQLYTFRQLCRFYLQDILVGKDPDPKVARSGKIGYAWDFFDGISGELAYFLKVMAEVKERRDKIKPELQFEGMTKQARDLLNRSANKKFLLFFEHWDVKGAETAYLEATQRMVDLRREDILHTYVVNTIQDMMEICEQTKGLVQNWIYYLATGDELTGVPGLWNIINKESQDLLEAYSWDKRIDKVQKNVADGELTVSDEDIEEAIKSWSWKVDVDGENISVIATIADPANPEVPLVLSLPVGSNQKNAEKVLADNLLRIFSLSKRSFFNHAIRTTVAEEIKDNRNYGTPQKFASEIIGGLAEPLYDGPVNSPRKRSNFIRIQTSANDPYFYGEDGVEGELRGAALKPRNSLDDKYAIQVVDSENPYKLTIVRTDDLYNFSDYSAWEECKKAYEAHFVQDGGNRMDPALLHIFPAEAAAVTLERSEYLKSRVYNELDSRVVMLLEDVNKLVQFVYLYALQKIKAVDTDSDLHWEMESPGAAPIWLTKPWISQIHQFTEPKPDLFNAIHGFVIHQLDQNPANNSAINYTKVQEAILAELDQRKTADKNRNQVEIDLIDHILGPQNVKNYILKTLAIDELGNERKDFKDLARVIDLLLVEKRSKLKSSEPEFKSF